MDDITSTKQPRATAKITDAEVARRREMVRQADASNRIEGQFRSPESDEVFDAFVRGDIDVTAMVPLLKLQLGLK